MLNQKEKIKSWRRGGDSNSRGALAPPILKTGALVHSATSAYFADVMNSLYNKRVLIQSVFTY